MNVRLATQVLSQTTANILYNYYPEETHGSAEFCEKMNKFFDCLNVRNQTECVKQRKETVAPYKDTEDERFEWLTDGFLKYLQDWKTSTENRKGKFTAKERQKCFCPNRRMKDSR